MTERGFWLPPWVLFIGVLTVLAYSAIDPVADRLTWFLETFPVMIGAVVLAATYRRHPLTSVTYHLIAFFCLILIWGGHYSYAENPLFDWLQVRFDLDRNYYDRFGHVMQGVIPGMLAREILTRSRAVNGRGWLFLFSAAIALSVSACYEFFEWWVAVISGSDATAFLATQGDPWDTQWDMFLALNGAVFSQLLLGRLQDRQIHTLHGSGGVH